MRLLLPIQKITVIDRRYGNERYDEFTRLKEEKTFDVLGNLIEHKEFDQGTMLYWYQYDYDRYNRIIRKRSLRAHHRNKGEYETTTTDLSYDQYGLLVLTDNQEYEEDGTDFVVTSYHVDGWVRYRRYFTAPELLLNQEEHYFKKGVSRIVHYDAYENLIKSENFRSDGAALNQELRTIDKFGQLYRIKKISRKRRVTQDLFFQYDRKGLVVADVNFPRSNSYPFLEVPHKAGFCTLYRYSEMGILQQKDYYIHGTLESSDVYTYSPW